MSNNISIIAFVEEKLRYVFNRNEKYIKWPEADLYKRAWEDVPEHAAAIGFILKNLVIDSIPQMSFWDLQKLGLDYLNYGAFSVKKVPLRNGTFTYEPLDIYSTRLGPEKNRVAIATDWTNYKTDIEWQPLAEGATDKGVFIFKSPLSKGDYSRPYWAAALKPIDTLVEINNYHNNNAKGGFTPNVVINFNNGEPDPETKRDIEKKIKEKFTGANGQKFIIAYNDSKETSVTIEKIENDNLDQKFETLQKFIQNQIVVAHQLTSPQLIGIKAENQGFSKTEFDEAFTIFDEVVVESLRKEFEWGLSKLFGTDVKLKRKGQIL